MLQVDAVSKHYNERSGLVRALDRASLSAAPGEMVTVQGPSGSGKTTLLLIAGGLLAPDNGRVLLDGQDPYAVSPSARAKLRASAIGFVFQQFHLIPYLDVSENVMAVELALPREGMRDRCVELLDRLGLADRAHHLPSSLSTGERQRTALARALVNNPRMLLADEPTGNLDPANGQIVLEALQNIAREGKIVVLATHDPVASRYADRVLHLHKGAFVSRSE